MKSIRLNIGKVAMMFMLIMTVFVSEIQAQVVDDSNTHRPKVGVVLCGGGAKGPASFASFFSLSSFEISHTSPTGVS